jgi:molecular chaperone Hsp33
MNDEMKGLQNFVFEATDIRGAAVRLGGSFAQLLERAEYSPTQQALLAEFTAAAVLLANNLKFAGAMILQARAANGTLVVAECRNDLNYRAVIEGDSDSWEFAELFAGGILTITLDPDDGQRYQGVVPLEQADLAGCLADYFQMSEQLPSWFYFAYENGQAAAFMLQALPQHYCLDTEQRSEDWQRVTHLASTLRVEEMLHVDFQVLLHRLYHEEQVLIFPEREVQFKCSCSRERLARALINLGADELSDILASEGKIETQCHFCHQDYHFHAGEISLLLQGGKGSN